MKINYQDCWANMRSHEATAVLRQVAQYLGLHCTDFSEETTANNYVSQNCSFSGQERIKVHMTFEVYEPAFDAYKQMNHQNASSHQWEMDGELHDNIEKPVVCSICGLTGNQNLYLEYMIFAREDTSCNDIKFKNLLK